MRICMYIHVSVTFVMRKCNPICYTPVLRLLSELVACSFAFFSFKDRMAERVRSALTPKELMNVIEPFAGKAS